MNIPKQLAPDKSPTELKIKPFEREDWDALWQLRTCQLAEQGITIDAAGAIPSCPDFSSPYERDYHRIDSIYLAGRGNFWIAWLMGQPVGHIGGQDIRAYELTDDTDFIELRRMYVRASYRRRGFGGQLVQTLIEHSRHQGVRQIKLWTHPSGSGRLLYRKLGFQELKEPGKHGKWIRDDNGEIRMALSL